MDLKKIFGAIAISVLFFFGIIFALAAAEDLARAQTRLVVAALLFIVAFGIAYFVAKKPKTVIQRLELSGPMKAVELKCPHCSASVDAKQIKISDGVPYATCPYCGQTFEVAEEPKW